MVEIIRCKPGESGEDRTAKRQKILGMHNKPCLYDGKEYKSLLALSHKLGVSKATVTRAIRKGEYKGTPVKLVNP